MKQISHASAQSLNHVQLFQPHDSSPPGSSVHGVLQARILEWVAVSFSRGLPNPGIKLKSPAPAGGFFATEPPGKPLTGLEPLLGILNLCFSFWYTSWFFTGLIYCFILFGAIYFSFTHFSLIFHWDHWLLRAGSCTIYFSSSRQGKTGIHWVNTQ